ncbi:tachykinin-like peptides receptor 99D [Tetranychus urticae]|uniref:G-protein coupled receptors family 1 profile domain-containing protein n=1 Tax=Tetranychus urticae TaxID=32264 RepID=T1JRX7_TETUR|nr:tachykinin-like peptides receptor 99D [Tetranychus urticae]
MYDNSMNISLFSNGVNNESYPGLTFSSTNSSSQFNLTNSDVYFINNSNYPQNNWSVSSSSPSPSDVNPLERNKFILPWWQQVIWTLVFGGMILVATGGNTIVIWLVLAHKRMRTVTNYFIVNLSIADIMVSTLNVIFNFTCMLNGDWPFGTLYCKISNYIAIVSVSASVLTLMAISIDRYVAIIYPLKPRMSKKTTVFITLAIWIIGSILSLPNILYSTTKREYFLNGDYRDICFLDWPDGPATSSKFDYIYNVIILLVTYMVPICSMCFTYSRVGLELWGSKGIGEYTEKQVESMKSKRKIVKMMIVVFVIFAVCWLPYHGYFLLTHHFPEMMEADYVQQIYLIIYWLAMSNSMYNPIIYCWMNSRFREGFKKIFCCLCYDNSDSDNFLESKLTRRGKSSFSEACITETKIRLNGNGHGTALMMDETIKQAEYRL